MLRHGTVSQSYRFTALTLAIFKGLNDLLTGGKRSKWTEVRVMCLAGLFRVALGPRLLIQLSLKELVRLLMVCKAHRAISLCVGA